MTHNVRYPIPPFPRGWYAICFSHELRPGQVKTIPLLGREYVVYRTYDGQPCAAEPRCPHLGAHLGHGGVVTGSGLRCPMHHFCFGPDGPCEPAGTGPRPPKARLRTLPLVERSGFLLTYHDPDGGPAWDLPVLSEPGWGDMLPTQVEMTTHVQDIAENTVDFNHLGPTHRYRDVQPLGPVRLTAHSLHARYAASRSADLYGATGRLFRFELGINLYGLSLYVIDSAVDPGGVVTRAVFAPTPVERERIVFRIGLWTVRMADVDRLSPLLRLVPVRLQRRLMGEMTRLIVRNDVMQDVRILNHKHFLPRPALAEGDGNLARFRKWASGFYPGQPAQ